MLLRSRSSNAALDETIGVDIVPVASIGRAMDVLVAGPSAPARQLTEFIAGARTNAGTIDMRRREGRTSAADNMVESPF
jgi:hypothetical protein